MEVQQIDEHLLAERGTELMVGLREPGACGKTVLVDSAPAQYTACLAPAYRDALDCLAGEVGHGLEGNWLDRITRLRQAPEHRYGSLQQPQSGVSRRCSLIHRHGR